MTTSVLTIAAKYSKANPARLLAMMNACAAIDQQQIPGDIVECGVWKGGHIILARMVSPTRTCWLYDTFTGMTMPGPFDRKPNGRKPPASKALTKNWTRASQDEVIANFKEHNLYDENKLKFIVGDVCETLRQAENIPDKIALLRLDTDWYQSTKVELEVLWPRLVSGGIIIIDDYGHWMGARKAVDDYFIKHYPLYTKEMKEIDYTGVIMAKR